MEAVLALALAVLTPPAVPAEDLGKLYPATMSHSESGLSWTTSPEDVFELKSFELSQSKDLAIECGKATLVLGVHESNVLWAVVFPEKPAEIETSEVPGDGETTSAILLRFAPSEVGRVFPKKTVKGRSDQGWLRARADRIFRNKIGWKWSTPSGNPTIVSSGFVIVDVDTEQGPRRFYGVDRNAGKVEYVTEFESKPVPALAGIGRREALAAFEEVWEAFDREYAKFVDLPDVNWTALKKPYEKLAGDSKTVFDLAAVIADMLAHLEDLHIWVKAGGDWLPGYSRPRPMNASWNGSAATVGAFRETKKDLVWARTEDGLGYVNVYELGDQALPTVFDEALENLADTWGLVVDLRFNGGGDELLARQLAGRFLAEPAVYSTNRYRSGKKHDDLGPVLERVCEPRGPWRYEAPIVVLQGQRTMSSAESLALMLAQAPGATTMGDRTAGSSGNPRRLELDCGIVVNLPRWRDADPDGNPIEGVGIAPDVALEFEEDAFSERADPVLAAALKRLRAIPSKDRAPGKR